MVWVKKIGLIMIVAFATILIYQKVQNALYSSAPAVTA